MSARPALQGFVWVKLNIFGNSPLKTIKSDITFIIIVQPRAILKNQLFKIVLC